MTIGLYNTPHHTLPTATRCDEGDEQNAMDTITKVYNDHPKTLLYSVGAVLRILLAIAFPGLPDLLTSRVEISTPINSFKRCMRISCRLKAAQAK